MARNIDAMANRTTLIASMLGKGVNESFRFFGPETYKSINPIDFNYSVK